MTARSGSPRPASKAGGRGRKNYRGQADIFGVYCPETDEVYLVPVDSVPVNEVSLRIDEPTNGIVKTIRWAKDYALT